MIRMAAHKALWACLPLHLSTATVPFAATASVRRVSFLIQSRNGFVFRATPAFAPMLSPRTLWSPRPTHSRCGRIAERGFSMHSERTAPNHAEIQDVALACQHLWELDSNRLQPGLDYELDLQMPKTSSWDEGESATAPLFTFIKPDVFERASVRAFAALLDNYVAETGTAEKITRTEAKEDLEFLHAILNSAPMAYVRNYLVAKQHLKDGSDNEMRLLLQHIWFRPYKREVRNDSSGFEHVFVGEIRDAEVVGLHNWIRILKEEQSGNLNYFGYIRSKSDAASPAGIHPSHDQVLSIQFEWMGHLKPIGTSFIGTSPEFEVALYTLCYLFGGPTTRVTLGPYQVDIKVHSIAGKFLGSAYPSEPKN